MSRRLTQLVVFGSLALFPSQTLAQTSGSSTQSQDAGSVRSVLATPAGHEVHVGVGGYTYAEPGDTSISIHGPKFGAGYTGTMSLNPRGHWFI